MGRLYLLGEGVEQDHWQSWSYWHNAAKQNYAEAQYGLGMLYLSGKVGKNLKEAKYYFGLACKNALVECL